MSFVLEKRLCLNAMAVPFFVQTLDFADHDSEEVMCLDLKATAEARWLEVGLNLPVRWWRCRHKDVPLLAEMKEAINRGKEKKGAAARVPRRPLIVVAITVRGREILVQNSTEPLTLVATKAEGDARASLQWFLEELQADLEESPRLKLLREPEPQPQAPQEPQEPQAPQQEQGPRRKTQQKHLRDDSEEQAMITQALATLLAHPKCLKAHWRPSRNAFFVCRDDHENSEFIAVGSFKHRKAAQGRGDDQSWEALRVTYHQAVSRAVEFLELDIDTELVMGVPLSDGGSSGPEAAAGPGSSSCNDE